MVTAGSGIVSAGRERCAGELGHARVTAGAARPRTASARRRGAATPPAHRHAERPGHRRVTGPRAREARVSGRAGPGDAGVVGGDPGGDGRPVGGVGGVPQPPQLAAGLRSAAHRRGQDGLAPQHDRVTAEPVGAAVRAHPVASADVGRCAPGGNPCTPPPAGAARRRGRSRWGSRGPLAPLRGVVDAPRVAR